MKKLYLFIFILGGAGCAMNKQEPKFEPLPPEKLHDLLHIGKNYAYKSVTKKDYESEDECKVES